MLSLKIIVALILVCVAHVPAFADVSECQQCSTTALEPNVECYYGNTTATTCDPASGAHTHCILITDWDAATPTVIRLCGNEAGYDCPDWFDCFFCIENGCNDQDVNTLL